MVYKASLDKTAVIITAAVTILFAAIIGSLFSTIRDTGRTPPILGTVVCVLIYLISYAFRPVRYTITPEELIIHRPLRSVHLKRRDIQRAEQVDKSMTWGSIRTFGVGGLFGYYGYFANFSLGRMTWYATRRDKTVLVTTVYKKKIILTPDEPGQFVSELMS
jgi:hypothetical protein